MSERVVLARSDRFDGSEAREVRPPAKVGPAPGMRRRATAREGRGPAEPCVLQRSRSMVTNL